MLMMLIVIILTMMMMSLMMIMTNQNDTSESAMKEHQQTNGSVAFFPHENAWGKKRSGRVTAWQGGVTRPFPARGWVPRGTLTSPAAFRHMPVDTRST